MSIFQPHSNLRALQEAVKRVERGGPRPGATALPFGVPEMDAHLPHRGLPLATLHEISGGTDYADDAAAIMFTAGVLARMEGAVLWCLRTRDLFMPGLACAGLHPEKIIYVEAGNEKTVLLLMEEGLRHNGLAGVVGDVQRLSLTAARRLHLAARSSGVTAFALHRHNRFSKKSDTSEPTAAATRWRISSLPSAPLPVKGIGRERWLVELTRCREGEVASWEMEACNAQGYLGSSTVSANRSATADQHALSA